MTQQRIKISSLFAYCGKPANEIATPVYVGMPFKEEQGPQHIFPQEYKAVWDTGAMGTSISRALAQSLSLPKIGETLVGGVTGTELCNVYLVSLVLPNHVVIPELSVSDCSGNIGCEVLIGMDVISQGDFAISNLNGVTSFTFRMPSIYQTDYTDNADQGYRSSPVVKIPKIGVNDLCPCGSGKKYKKCCGPINKSRPIKKSGFLR